MIHQRPRSINGSNTSVESLNLIKRMAKFRKNPPYTDEYNVGDRIAQIIIMPYPAVTFVEVADLSNSDRGQGGYGSSGK